MALAFVLFCAGIGVGWWLRSGPPAPAIVFDAPTSDHRAEAVEAVPTETPGPEPPDVDAPASVTATIGPDNSTALRDRDLRLPIDDIKVQSLKNMFEERRGGGRPHEAVDMLAPRNTPVHAVDDGAIAKLFVSKAGGNTTYQFDPSSRFAYYYAHLERYADGLKDGDTVERGDVIGYVGTTGNAPPNTPHLHFAILELTPERHWWQGKALDPFLIFHD